MNIIPLTFEGCSIFAWDVREDDRLEGGVYSWAHFNWKPSLRVSSVLSPGNDSNKRGPGRFEYVRLCNEFWNFPLDKS